jgi:predicted enzyme related to lactoylglutathione lyase
MNPAPILHFDISGPDDDALRRFYASVFNWTIDDRGPGYALVTTPALRGAIAESEEPSLTLGIGVADLDAAAAHVVANGGTVVMPPTNNGWVTKMQVTDPSGNFLTLIQT